MLPREHGSWAVFLAPVLVGLFVAPGGDRAAQALFFAGALAAFLARTPIVALAKSPNDARARRWLLYYALAAAVLLAPLILAWGRWGLLAFGAAAVPVLLLDLRSQLDRRGMSLGNELTGIAGLALGAPAAWYSAQGRLEPAAWALWAACVLYFWGPVFHVKLAALQHRSFADPAARARLPRSKARTLSYHFAAFALACGAAQFWSLRWVAVVPFLAALVKTALRASRGPEKVEFKKLGYQEIGFSVLFVACLLLA